MALFTIGDLHLSLSADKPMDVFNGWVDYITRLKDNWNASVTDSDMVVLAGDTSWAIKMQNAIKDFAFLESLPGKKIVLKGNHDYWWGSVTSMKKILNDNSIFSIDFLNNNSFIHEDYAICGSRGWLFENGEVFDEKIIKRESMRISSSLASVSDDKKKKILFLHYPPVYNKQEISEYLEIMNEYCVKDCFYGHIHGFGHKNAVTGQYKGINFHLISSDFIDFNPFRIG